MLPHHQKAIDEFIAHVADEGVFDAVILSGSVGRGTARADSDVDVYLVVDADDYEDRRARDELAVLRGTDAYPGGYFDGKVVSVDVLAAAAERGPEPMRASFTGAKVVFSRVEGLDEVVARIPVYPEANRARNIREFYSHFAIHGGYFAPRALGQGDPFMISHSLANTVLYAGRLLLAHNRVLFPCAKQLMKTLGTCDVLPDAFILQTEALLRDPSGPRLTEYVQTVSDFADWGLPHQELVTVFMKIDEWSWLHGHEALAQR